MSKTMKKTITETIYREIADKLRTHLKDQVYWAGSIEGADWRFTASCTKCGNEILPVWWEFYIEENGNVVADDFSFERLKKYFVCKQ